MKRALLNTICPYALYRGLPPMTAKQMADTLAWAYRHLGLTHLG